MKSAHLKPSDIEAGFYYERIGHPGWLRRVIDFRGYEGRVRYVDFTGVSQCDASHLSRWAKRRLTSAEAMDEFPNEVAKMETVLGNALVTWQERADRMIQDLIADYPGLTRHKVVEYLNGPDGI